MSFLSDALGFEQFHAKDLWERLKDDKKRLLLGVDPWSTKVWNKVLGRDDEPLVDQMGGAYGGHTLSAFDNKDGGVYERARAAGIDTTAGGQMQDAAHVIAAFYALGGGNLGGGGAEAAGGGQQSPFGFGPEMFQGGGGGGMGMNFNPFGGGVDPNMAIPGATPGINPMAGGAQSAGGGGILGSLGGGSGFLNGGGLTAEQAAALQAASSYLMQAGGYTTMPTTFGQAFGGAMDAGRGAYEGQIDSGLKRDLMRSQIEENRRGKQYQSKYQNLINKRTYEIQPAEVGSAEFNAMLASGEWALAGDMKQPSDENDKRERMIKDAMELYGFSRADAVKRVDDYLKVSSTPDAAGLVTTTDLTNNTAYQTAPRLVPSAPAASTPNPATAQPPPTAQPLDANPQLPYVSAEERKAAQERLVTYSRVKSGAAEALASLQGGAVGPVSNLKAVGTQLAALVGSPGFADNYQNRAILEQFNANVVAALANNEKVPVWEQQQLKGLMPKPQEFLTDPENATARMAKVLEKIDKLERIDDALLRGEALPVNERGLGTREEPYVFRSVKEAGRYWDDIKPGQWWINPKNGEPMRKK